MADIDIIASQQQAAVIVEVGKQGPAGPKGADGSTGPAGSPGSPGPSGTGSVVYDAGIPLSGHRVVFIDTDGLAYYADHDRLQDSQRVLGITIGAVTQHAPAVIMLFGEMTEPTWSWIEGFYIFLGSNGVLTQTPPVTGFQMEVAFAITSTKIMINPKPPIVLA